MFKLPKWTMKLPNLWLISEEKQTSFALHKFSKIYEGHISRFPHASVFQGFIKPEIVYENDAEKYKDKTKAIALKNTNIFFNGHVLARRSQGSNLGRAVQEALRSGCCQSYIEYPGNGNHKHSQVLCHCFGCSDI